MADYQTSAIYVIFKLILPESRPLLQYGYRNFREYLLIFSVDPSIYTKIYASHPADTQPSHW